MQQRIGVLVGMQSEARLARHLHPVAIEASGATIKGAEAALQRLLDAKADAIVSFGFAAGLDPVIKPGAILVPYSVQVSNQEYNADTDLRSRLGAEQSKVKVGALLHSDFIITSSKEKQVLFEETGCIAADMESGVVARYCVERHIPFAALRVVCDSATRDLPSVVCMALSSGGNLNIPQIIKSLVYHPAQIFGLVGVGVDAGIAFWQLNRFIMTDNVG